MAAFVECLACLMEDNVVIRVQAEYMVVTVLYLRYLSDTSGRQGFLYGR